MKKLMLIVALFVCVNLSANTEGDKEKTSIMDITVRGNCTDCVWTGTEFIVTCVGTTGVCMTISGNSTTINCGCERDDQPVTHFTWTSHQVSQLANGEKHTFNVLD